MDLFVKQWSNTLSYGVEAIASLLIAYAILESLVTVIYSRLHRCNVEAVRAKLGRWLALALEFEVAADILRTAVAPSWDQIGQLAAIAVIRTFLNYFLEKDLSAVAQETDHK